MAVSLESSIDLHFPECLPHGGEFPDPMPHVTLAKPSLDTAATVLAELRECFSSRLPLAFNVDEAVVMAQQPDLRRVNRLRLPLTV
jgi:hypothetical protein